MWIIIAEPRKLSCGNTELTLHNILNTKPAVIIFRNALRADIKVFEFKMYSGNLYQQNVEYFIYICPHHKNIDFILNIHFKI